MHFELLIPFAIVFFLDSISPGPAVATVVAKGATTGLRRTLPFIAGLVLGDLFLFALAIAGLAALAAAMGPLFSIIKWIGISYLIFLAYKMWTAKPAPMSRIAPKDEGVRLFALGCILPMANPKAVGFYVALLPAVMDVTQISLSTALEFSAVIIIVWGGTLAAYTAAADRASGFISTPKAQRALNRTAAGAMLGAAGTIASK